MCPQFSNIQFCLCNNGIIIVPVIVPDWAESRVEGNLEYFKQILTPEEIAGEVREEVEQEFRPIGTSLFWGSDDAKRYETLCRQPIKMVAP